MNKKRIEQSLKTALEQTTPNVLDNILSLCGNQDGKVIKMKSTNRKKSIKTIIAVAAAFAIIVGGFAVYNSINKAKKDIVYSTVTFDVNPSIEISLTENEKVVDIKALNDHAKNILGDKNYKDTSLDITVDEIITSMIKNGYIDEYSNSILISVDSKSNADSLLLAQKLNRSVEGILNTDKFKGSVLSQTIKHNDKLDKAAEKHGITIGKAQLINDIVNADDRYSFEQLIPLTINELNLISQSGKLLSSSINVTGTASDKGYITAEEAKKNALDYSGITVKEYSNNAWYWFYSYENDGLIFEISLYYDNFEYKYDIDATSGKILNAERINNTNTTVGTTVNFKKEIFEYFTFTYDDFVDKYGKEINRSWDSGALFCEFENALGKYAFYNTDYDEIKGSDKCFALDLNAKYVFNNLNEKISITDLAKGVDCEIATSFDEMEGKGYISTFKYNEYTITFNTGDKKFIDQNTVISIVIK